MSLGFGTRLGGKEKYNTYSYPRITYYYGQVKQIKIGGNIQLLMVSCCRTWEGNLGNKPLEGKDHLLDSTCTKSLITNNIILFMDVSAVLRIVSGT